MIQIETDTQLEQWFSTLVPPAEITHALHVLLKALQRIGRWPDQASPQHHAVPSSPDRTLEDGI